MRADISQFRGVFLRSSPIFFIVVFLAWARWRGRILSVVPTVRAAVLIILAFATVWYFYMSIHWQMMVDSPIMHYVKFLMDHGREPYTDITDNNMPAAYYTEAWAMHIFGGGDVGWRVYEYFLLITLTAVLVVIAKP